MLGWPSPLLGGMHDPLPPPSTFTHRGFEMPEWLKFLFATGSAVRRPGSGHWVEISSESDTDEIHSPIHHFYAGQPW